MLAALYYTRIFNLRETKNMKLVAKLVLVMAAATGSAQAHDDPVNCDNCADWNKPVKPFNVYGNTWHVGVDGLSSVLVTGPKGHILVDGGLPQSAPLIEANIKALGFRMKDVKLIVNSHAHWDHAGGIAALQRASGAVVAASRSGALAMQSGTNPPDDPQFQANPVVHVAKVAKVKVVGEGEILKVGPISVTAHMTPGHAPGGTTWTWTSCEGKRCLDVVFADSLNSYASGDFKFTGTGKTPDISTSFAASIAKVAALKCDIIISGHPGLTDLMEKAAARTPDSNPLIDAAGCRAYAAEASERLTKRLVKERGG
ncbi:subclass B3 metallo-beta-lactamase [Massilia sp. CMS3.1]|uniref:subclass B3 metallo-beta-lactamase n=1 Tax=Massilia sp. CMS3.1 TaxID=3373083 RepID=UPI003EE51CB8